MSFDVEHKAQLVERMASQSLWNRAMSFDLNSVKNVGQKVSQSLWNRAMSFDMTNAQRIIAANESQSLWNRAMSFDLDTFGDGWKTKPVSIPLEQGNVFRPISANSPNSWVGLNPFGTGQCLSTTTVVYHKGRLLSLNPFGTGQCLSTILLQKVKQLY